MKNILVYLMLAATFLLSACDKDEKMLEPSYLPVTYANIAGTWQLAEWNGVEMSEGRYCYLVIKRKADEETGKRALEIYTNIDSDKSHLLTSTYELEEDEDLGSIISGIYDHAAGFWNNSYLISELEADRMPTICGFRRRGYSPESIHKFIDKIGYTTYDALNEFALLESAVREDLNARATRISAVLNPVKLIITNYPEGQVEEMEAINNPERPEEGSHNIEFSRELWIERDDFMEDAPKKYFRMTPGQEVRLKSAYIVKCTGCKKNDAGEITEVYCEYDPDSKSGMPGANRKVKGTIHWVSCAHCLQAEVRLYDRLWKVENPRDELAAIREAKNCDALTAMKEMINPDSLNVLPCCYIEKYAAGMKPLSYLQFQRIGYFNVDRDSTTEKMVFNRTVGLKDTWGKINK